MSQPAAEIVALRVRLTALKGCQGKLPKTLKTSPLPPSLGAEVNLSTRWRSGQELRCLRIKART